MPHFLQQGIFESKNYAIFQSRSLGKYWNTPRENGDSLLRELKTLTLGQFFLNSYKARAMTYNYKNLPGKPLNYL